MYSANSWKLATIKTHAQAADYYEKTKPWRGKDPNIRPVGTRRQVTSTIRKDGDDYVVRFHDTDIIRFKPNGSLYFVAYASMSTNAIARRFAPNGILLDYNDHGYFVGQLNEAPAEDGKYQDWVMSKVSKNFALHPQSNGRWLIEGTQAMKRTSVDRKAANKIYKEVGYNDFAAFMRAAEKLNPPEEVQHWRRYTQHWDRHVSRFDVVRLFEEGLNGWHKLAEKLPRPTQVLEIVRLHLVKQHNCLKVTDVYEVEGWRSHRNIIEYNAKLR